MNYKQAALDHVREVCPELKCSACDGDGILTVPDPNDPSGNTPMQEQCNYCAATGMANTPHLEHWLRGMMEYEDIDIQTMVIGEENKPAEEMYLHIFKRLKVEEVIAEYNLTKDGENQGEEFYRAYCEIVGIMNLK